MLGDDVPLEPVTAGIAPGGDQTKQAEVRKVPGPLDLLRTHDALERGEPHRRAAGVTRVEVALTPLSEAGERIAADTAAALASADAEIVTDRDRAGGRGYYRDVCFKVNALADGAVVEIGDGGFTDWTARLLNDAKERCLISCLSTERMTALAAG